MASKFARVGGSSITQFNWGGSVIAFAHQVELQSPTPVAQTVPIHPLNNLRPVELITPFAITMGTMVIELYELFGEKTWAQLGRLGTTTVKQDGDGGHTISDLADIFQAVAEGDSITINKTITPKGSRGNSATESYHGCVISALQDDETIQIGTMEVLKRYTVNYQYSKWVVG